MEEKGSIEKVMSLLPQGGGGDLIGRRLENDLVELSFFVVCDNGQPS